MPGLSKVIVLDPDARAVRQIQLGFQREGIPAEVAEVPPDPAELALPAQDAGLVVVGGADARGLELVRQARRRLGEASVDAPIVFAGRGVRRTDAETAGADEVVLQPAYLRDVVTIGKLLHGQPASHRAHLVGSLVETSGVLTLVRALAALGRSAVLTLIRGLRRGEVRFYHGEVTSAQVGMIHGQAALHQLLLWTDARFDFHHEDIVRRHQIPLERDELFADAERFLAGVRESSGALSPSMVLEQDAARVRSLGKQIPIEVHGVLRMFDGHRVLADALEDSPYRVFETLRVAQLAVEAGLLRQAPGPQPRPTWRPVLPLEEWLVGAEPREEGAGGDGAAGPQAAADGAGRASSGPGRSKSSRRKRKKRRANTPVPAAPAAAAPKTEKETKKETEIDWGSLVPRVAGAEVGPLACVVPASHASGEINLPPPELLEESADAPSRDGTAPAEVASIVWDEAANAPEALEVPQAAVEEVEPKRTLPMPTVAVPAVPPVPAVPAVPDMPAEARRTLPMQTVAESAAGAPNVPVEAVPTAPMRAPAAAAAAAAAAAPNVPAEAVPTAPMRAPSIEPRPAAVVGPDDAALAEPTPAPVEPPPEEPAAPAALAEAVPTAPMRPAAAVPAVPAVPAEAVPTAPMRGPPAEPPPAEPAAPIEPVAPIPTVPMRAAPAAPATPPSDGDVEPPRDEPAIVSGELEAPPAAGDPASLADAPPEASPAKRPSDGMPEITIEAPPSSELPPVIVDLPSIELERAAAPVGETTDEPSDGVIRQVIAAAETAPASRRPPSSIPIDDRPEDATGEIVTRTAQRAAVEPPTLAEPSILVADLAEVHTAVASVADAHASAPPTPSMATPAAERTVAEVSDDAVAFTDVEEDFFRAGQEKVTKAPAVPTESFDDLDEGYRPVGFWDRLLGRRPKR